MATSSFYFQYMQDQLSGLDVSFQAMMGEYILYFRSHIAGGLYDNRLLIKDVPAAYTLLPASPLEEPYPGAKPMLLVENTDDRDFLAQLLETIHPELPLPKKKKSR